MDRPFSSQSNKPEGNSKQRQYVSVIRKSTLLPGNSAEITASSPLFPSSISHRQNTGGHLPGFSVFSRSHTDQVSAQRPTRPDSLFPSVFGEDAQPSSFSAFKSFHPPGARGRGEGHGSKVTVYRLSLCWTASSFQGWICTSLFCLGKNERLMSM